MSIKVNEIASIKTSLEPVFVLKIQDGTVTVRRPIMGNDGVRHVTEEFLEVELETESDRIERTYKEKAALQSRVFTNSEPSELVKLGPAN